MTASVKSMEDMYEGSMAADIYIVLMKNEEAVDYNGTSYGLGPGVIKKVESSSLSDLPEAEFTDDVTSIAGYSMEEYKITTINLINSYTVPEKIEVDNAKYTVTAIEEGAFYECPATEISLPSTLETIGKKAFYKSSVTSIDFSSTKITSIAEETFYESKIETISLPSALESIGDRGFYRSCLKSIDLSKTKITSIGKEVFCNNSDAAFMLETVILPPNLETIGYMSFAYTGIKSIVIPSSVTSIGEYAFWNSSYLQSIEIPSSVTSIGKYAFGMCNCLTGFVLPEKVTSINAGVFSWCNGLTKIEISGQVTSIGDNAFIQCSKMEKVSLPSSVESIGSSAFSGCSSLTSIELPSTVTSIGDKAFYNTKNVVTITCESEIAPTLGGADVFTNSSASILKVPAAAATSYKTTQYWADFTYTSDYITEYTRNTKADKFGTICLPYAYTPTNATLYSVKEIAEDHVSLEKVTDNQGVANTPYIYQATEDSPSFNCTDTSDISEETTTAPTNDALTGSLYDGSTTAPEGSYVLQTQEDEQAFYPVAAGSTISVKPHRAYLNASENASALRIAFNDEETSATTGVEALRALTGDNPAIYDLNGRRLKTLQKGVNIVNGVKVYVK